MRLRLWALTALLAVLSACAPQVERITSASAAQIKPIWAFQASDIPVDPAFRFGQLANGMRYVIRQNATPKGMGSVRMEVATGSLDEGDGERGYAHFVEHMAFNGSTRFPQGEMVRLLEREGLAFGADTNALTSFNQTTYMLDLPRNDRALLDTALMLMRETASELTFDPKAVTNERGVVLSEMRDRNTWQLRNLEDQFAFLNPHARYTRRMPIGTAEGLNAATAESLRAFWRREYVPASTTVIVIGDFAPDLAEAAIRKQFESWTPAPAEMRPEAGPVDRKQRGQTDVYIEQAMSERVTASRHGPWLNEIDTVAQRREGLLRQIGYAIVNRRLQHLSLQSDPPFRDAGFGTAGVMKAGRTTNLVVNTVDGKWRRGLMAASVEYRRAMRFGFTRPELDEQIAVIRETLNRDAASAQTRSNAALINAVFGLLRDDKVPATPESALARFEAFAPEITPERVLKAIQREVVPLSKPLLRFQGRQAPAGGAPAIRDAWEQSLRQPIRREQAAASLIFGYTTFGPPGTIASDTREPALDIREVRFANGVRLNLKRSDIEKDHVALQVSIDGGKMLNTVDNPLATEMVMALPYGGLGKHSHDDLQSILAGHTANFNFESSPETFDAAAQTTPRDLELQLQLLTAYVSDPGYRAEGELRYRLNINNFFAAQKATPVTALGNAIGGILSDNDPRFTLQKVEDYRKLTFARLKSDISDRLHNGAIEIGIVGDFDEDQAIALTARTLGALPAREADFRPYSEQRQRPYTSDNRQRVLRHVGPKDQALIRFTWPTRDDSDPVDTITLSLLERVAKLQLTETLREKLGKAYSPSANSNPSRFWKGYGVFGIAASIDPGSVPMARAAIAETVARLRDGEVSADELLRARQPLIENYDNALKSNRGLLALVDRAQTEPDQIDRFLKARDRLQALTAADVQAMARRYLSPDKAVEVLVLPEGVDEPTP